MPDINDILPFLSGNPPAPPQTDQAPPPPQSADIMSQLFGGTSYPQQNPQANGLQQLQQGVNNPLFTEDPADAYHKFINKLYYGNQDGSEPTRKQKILRPIEDMLESIVGYQRPELKMLPAAQQAYQEQTSRLGQQTGLEHWLGTIFNQQQRNATLQQNADTNAYRAQLTGNENIARDQARNLRNTIEKSYREAQEQHLSAEDTRLKVQNDYQQFQMKNPGNPLQYAEVLQKAAQAGDNSALDDYRFILPVMMGLGLAKNPLASYGTTGTNTSTTDTKTGVTTTNRQERKNFVLPGLLGQGPTSGANGSSFIQNLLQGMPKGGSAPGAPQAPPQANPVVPPQANPAASAPPSQPAQPAAPSTSPAIPGLNSVNETPDYTNSRIPVPPGMKLGGDVAKKRIADQEARTDAIRQIGAYGMNARNLGQTLMGAIGNGTAQDYTGLVQGSPLMQDIRSSLGEVKPEEALLRGGLFESLYGKLKASMKGRYNLPEISAAGRMVGGQNQKAGNALMAATMLSLQSDAQRLYENGQLDQSKSQQVSQAMLTEMRRVQGLVKDKGAYAVAHQSGTDRIRSLEEVMSDVGQKQVPIYKNGQQVGTVRQDQLTKALSQGYSPKP